MSELPRRCNTLATDAPIETVLCQLPDGHDEALHFARLPSGITMEWEGTFARRAVAFETIRREWRYLNEQERDVLRKEFA